jgi:transposase
MGEGRGVYRVLIGMPEGKRPLGRPRRRWENNIKMDLREIGMDGAKWIRLAQDRVQWRACVKERKQYFKSSGHRSGVLLRIADHLPPSGAQVKNA